MNRPSSLAAAVLAVLPCLPIAAATVRVDSAAGIASATASAKRGDEIVLEQGVYRIERPIGLRQAGVTLRGATGKPQDVVIEGTGMNQRNLQLQEAIDIAASDVSVRDLTIRGFYFNGIHLRAESDADRVTISDVDTWNIGEVHIKGSRDPGSTATTDGDLIERVHARQTEARQLRPETDASSDYIGGIDIMAARDLTVRDCVFEDIHGAKNEGKPAIFLWNGIENPTIERNRIRGCARGIGIGNPGAPAPNLTTGNHHGVGGVIRNNMIVRGPWGGGNTIAIELCSVKGLLVANNTVYSEDASYFRTVSIFVSDGGGAIEDLVFADNLIRGQFKDFTDGRGWRREDEPIDGSAIEPTWFADVASGDLHLTDAAKPALGAGKRLDRVRDDIDGDARPKGAVDLGADQRSGARAAKAKAKPGLNTAGLR